MPEFFRIETVADGVHAAIVRPGAGAWGNAAIVDLGDRTLVFDTFYTPAAAEALRAEAEARTGKPVTLVVNSHEHPDHVHGNQVFTDALVVSASRTREVMAQRRPAFLKMARASSDAFMRELEGQRDAATDPALRQEAEALLGEVRALLAALDVLTVRLPDVTFQERLTIRGTARTAELISWGGGHSPSDAFLYLPDDRVLLSGDLVQVGFHPAWVHGDPDTWDRILERMLAELDIDAVVPGHGEVGDAEDVAKVRRYIDDMRALSERAALDGISPAEVACPEPYRGWQAPSVFQQNLQALLERRSRDRTG